MVADRLASTEGVNVGDVITITSLLNDRQNPGRTFPWTRFAAVVEVFDRRCLSTLTLRMEITDSDLRTIDVTLLQNSVYPLPPEQWPQGVSAMYVKAVAKGWIKLD